MEMSDLSVPLVDRSTRATIPHTVDWNDDLLLRYTEGRGYELNNEDRKKLSETIKEHKPRTSWSVFGKFTFSLRNPLLIPYLERGVNLAAVVFARLWGGLPSLPRFPQLVTGISAAYEGYACARFADRDIEIANLYVISAVPIALATIGIEGTTVGNGPYYDLYNLFPLIIFQTALLSNIFFIYHFGKAEYDLELQLENLQALLEKYPQLETHLELLHSNPNALDNAFLGEDNKPILSPYYEKISVLDQPPRRRYLTLSEFYTLIKNPENPETRIFCDRKRFQKVLTIFKNAQAQNA